MIDREEKSAYQVAQNIRRSALQMVHRAGSSHIGGCLSSSDLLAHLYTEFLLIDPNRPAWPGRDRFILSKGHSAAAAYSILAELGFFSKEKLKDYCQDGTELPGHIHHSVPGVEVSTGSLGHGLSIGLGMALYLKRTGTESRVAVLLSDGDCNEGSTWEAALMAPHLELDNLLVIIDHNKLQAFGRTGEVLPLQSLAEKWRAFRWAVREIDGHNHNEISACLGDFPFEEGKPSIIVAHTIKGKGVSFMEDQLLWHYKSPDDEQLRQALAELQTDD